MARLDVAMFNAILRDSDDEIPTDPVSDPISDAKVLPIPAGRASFGAGAQLKNAVRITNLFLLHRKSKYIFTSSFVQAYNRCALLLLAPFVPRTCLICIVFSLVPDTFVSSFLNPSSVMHMYYQFFKFKMM